MLSLVSSFPSSCAPSSPHICQAVQSGETMASTLGVCVFNRNVLSTYCVPRTVQFLSSHRLKKTQPCPSVKSILVLRSVLQEGQTEGKPWVQKGNG